LYKMDLKKTLFLNVKTILFSFYSFLNSHMQ
jgi:hypothetical protein